MAIFSTNSVRHLIVANAYNNSLAGTTAGPGSATVSDAGTVTAAVKNATSNELSIKFINANGVEVSSDNIPIANIRSVTSKAYSPKCLRKDSISFDAPVVGETYTIRLLIRSWGSGSAENQYFKHVGSYKAVSGSTATTVVDAIIANAAKNFAREPFPIFTFTKELGATAADTKLIITEYAQNWVKGKQQGRNLDYSIQFVKINSGGVEDTEWGTVTNIFKGYPGIGTNQVTADMEYFFLGERGDIYRNVGYPYTFDTAYLTDSTANYSTIDIAYFTQEPGLGASTQNEKVLTIVCKEAATANAQYAVQILVAGAINTATGATTVPVLSNINTIILKDGSLGTAASTSATGLTTATKYVVYVNPGTATEAKRFVKADGSLSAVEADIANLSGTAITPLVTGTRYFVKVY